MQILNFPDWSTEFFERLQKAYKAKRVLVLGGDGFLGANVALALKHVGAHVTITTRRNSSRIESEIDHVIKGDLNDIGTAKLAVRNQDYIFDLIGQTGAVESNSASYENFQVECQPHLNVFKSCADLNRDAVIVFCSSRLVYGKPQYLPVDEDHPLSPDSLYAIHKVTLENYLQVFGKLFGLKSVSIRLSNPYGPNMELKEQSYGLINIFIQQALAESALCIYGDGNQRRDYIHTDDLSGAFLCSAVTPKAYGKVINLGGESNVSIREVAQTISDATHGKPLEFIDWPDAHRMVESGDYSTSLKLAKSLLKLPPQKPFNESLLSLVGQYRQAIAAEAQLSSPSAAQR